MGNAFGLSLMRLPWKIDMECKQSIEKYNKPEALGYVWFPENSRENVRESK